MRFQMRSCVGGRPPGEALSVGLFSGGYGQDELEWAVPRLNTQMTAPCENAKKR